MGSRYTGVIVGAPIPRDWDYAKTPEEARARRRERRQRWIDSLSERDWDRLARAADETLAGRPRARFDDLDAPIAVGVVDPRTNHQPNGERFGMLRGCILMAWEVT